MTLDDDPHVDAGGCLVEGLYVPRRLHRLYGRRGCGRRLLGLLYEQQALTKELDG